MARVIMRHKAFVGPSTYWNFRSLNDNRESIRAQAEAFINMIGAENVVSVAEHAMSLGPFSVVVWYRDDELAVAESLQETREANDGAPNCGIKPA